MSGDERVEIRDGHSDMVTFEVVGAPQPGVKIMQVGDDPDIHYRYHHEERGEPTPEDFERVNHIEVKLVVMQDLPDEVQEAVDDAHEAIVDLKNAMADARDLDDKQRQEVAMGNLDALPEVESR